MNKAKNWHLFFLFFIVLNSSCSDYRLFLSKSEYDYLKEPRDYFLSLHYDKKAIQGKTSDGVYKVMVYYSNTKNTNSMLCRYDTLTIKSIAVGFASKVEKIMNYKNNYKYIDVYLDNDEKNLRTNMLNESVSCSFLIRVDIKNKKNTFIVKKINTIDAASLRY